jgi:ABC-type antimicrobial peptide transport system permease subunit
MSHSSHAEDPVITTVLQDPAKDTEHHENVQAVEEHDHETDVAHAWHHFRENAYFFAGFLSIILLTVFAFNVNFGPYNLAVTLVLAAIRSALIAYFLSTLFKNFTLVFRTLFFTAIFLGGMIWLSLWDSTVKAGTVGNPIMLPEKFHESPVESSST